MADKIKSPSSVSTTVELGFVQKTPSWLLRSKFFRSKVGGRPAWLALENLPEAEKLACANCGEPRSFLLQVYAPLEDNDDAFHRTVFLFVCTNGKCNQKLSHSNFVALRSQLPRENKFYSYDPPDEEKEDDDDDDRTASKFSRLCAVCGCRGHLKCENCDDRVYCCENHKNVDRKSGHVDSCGSNAATTDGKKKKKKKKQKYDCLLPEYEIVTDMEDLPPPSKERSEKERMQEYEQFLRSAKAKHFMQDEQLNNAECFTQEPDKLFHKFKKRIDLEPDQILRYQRGGIPLWVSSELMPSNSDIPNCSNCGAERIFEFQVMPQLLNYLKLDSVEDSVDWGTLICYTCSKSCNVACTTYVDEFVWKQDFSSGNENK